MASDYSEKLRDPRWQKVRLKVLERDNWKCLCCEDGQQTLVVHHLVYSAKEPWDSPLCELETLCEQCHDMREGFNQWIQGRTTTPTSALRWVGVLLAQAFAEPNNHWDESGRNIYRFMERLMQARREFIKGLPKEDGECLSNRL